MLALAEEVRLIFYTLFSVNKITKQVAITTVFF